MVIFSTTKMAARMKQGNCLYASGEAFNFEEAKEAAIQSFNKLRGES